MYNTLLAEGFFTVNGNIRIVKNKNTNAIIEINKSGIQETFGRSYNFANLGKQLKYLKLETIRNIPDLLESAVLIDENVKNRHKDNSSVLFDYYRAETTVNGIPITVEFDIKKSTQKNKFWVHRINIKENAEVNSSGATSALKRRPNLDVDNSISKDLDNVNTDNEKSSKDLTEQEMSENKISTLAGHLRQKYKSSFEKDTLIEELRGIYKLYKEENYSSANDRAMELGKAILSQVKSEKVIDENAKSILKDIRNRRIRVSDTQIAEAKYLFGNSWRDRFFGRVIFTNKAKTSLDQQWQEWCELYPQYFKSDVNDADMILQLSEILDNLKKQAQYSVPVDTSSMLAPILKDIMEGVFSSGVEKKYANRMSEAERRQVLDEILSTSLKRWGVDIGRVEQSPGMSIEETVKKVKDSFGINITDGGDASVSGKGILDSYNVDSKTIRTKFKNDLPSIAHALGYHIESKLKVIDKVIEQTEAVRISNGDGIGEFERELLTMSTSAEADSRTRIREGFAEFIRMYLTSKPLALDAAPIFYSFFEAQLKDDSELAAAVEASAEAISGYFAQSFGDRAESAIMTAEEWKKLNKPRGKEAAMRLRNWVTVRLVDRFYGIKNAEKLHGTFDLTTSKNAYVRATLSLQSRGRAARILEDGFYDANGNKIGDSYFDIISPLGADYSDKFKDFGNYLTYVHAIEWLEPNDQTGKKTSSGKDIYKAKAKGKVFGDETLNDADKLRSLIARYEAKYSDFKSIARKIYKYQDNLMEYYLIPSGALSRDQAETFRAQYPHYVPFNRFNSVFGDAVGSGKFGATNIFANLKNPIRKADGGNAPIRNPLESIINSTLAAVDFKIKNDTMLALIDEFTGNGSIPGVMERIYSSKELEKLNKKGKNPFIVEEMVVNTDKAKTVNISREDSLSQVLKKLSSESTNEKNIFNVSSLELPEANSDIEAIEKYFDNVGELAVNQDIGKVEIKKKGIKSTIYHNYSKSKVIAAMAIKDVIENGKIQLHNRNWKGRGYDTYVITGKGVIDGKDSLVGVIVKSYPQTDMINKFYVHEVIEMEVTQNTAADKGVTDVIEATSTINSIPQYTENVNVGRENKTTKYKSNLVRDNVRLGPRPV